MTALPLAPAPAPSSSSARRRVSRTRSAPVHQKSPRTPRSSSFFHFFSFFPFLSPRLSVLRGNNTLVFSGSQTLKIFLPHPQPPQHYPALQRDQKARVIPVIRQRLQDRCHPDGQDHKYPHRRQFQPVPPPPPHQRQQRAAQKQHVRPKQQPALHQHQPLQRRTQPPSPSGRQ